MSEYSFSLTTFSPNGKLVQIEHALNAVNTQGRPALGIKAKHGVVILTEKKTTYNSLIDERSIRKTEAVAEHIGCLYSGMPADFRIILTKARKESQKYYQTFKSPIPVKILVRQIAMLFQEFTQSGGVRPFGVSVLICGYDSLMGMQLYQIDPSGAYFAWNATALGKDNASAKTFLEKRYSSAMEIDDAILTGLLTLKENFEGAINESNIEIGVVSEDGHFRNLTTNEIKEYISEVE